MLGTLLLSALCAPLSLACSFLPGSPLARELISSAARAAYKSCTRWFFGAPACFWRPLAETSFNSTFSHSPHTSALFLKFSLGSQPPAVHSSADQKDGGINGSVPNFPSVREPIITSSNT
ncbi:uncharacterized [Tachysurus ichikawai]